MSYVHADKLGNGWLYIAIPYCQRFKNQWHNILNTQITSFAFLGYPSKIQGGCFSSQNQFNLGNFPQLEGRTLLLRLSPHSPSLCLFSSSSLSFFFSSTSSYSVLLFLSESPHEIPYWYLIYQLDHMLSLSQLPEDRNGIIMIGLHKHSSCVFSCPQTQ